MEATQGNPRRWTVVAALLPLQFSMGLNFFGPSALFPLIMNSLGIGRGEVSLLVTTVTIAMTLLMIPAGILVPRIGTKKALVIAGMLMGCGILGGFRSDLPALIAYRIGLGMGASLLFPATSMSLVQWFKRGELPLANGMNLSAQGLGVAVAMFLGVPIANHWGWPAVFLAFGAFTLVAAAIWAIFGRQAPHNGTATAPPSPKAILLSLRDRNALVVAVAGMAPQALFVAFSSWLPTYYHEVFGMSLARATAIVTIPPIMGIVVNTAGGALMTRVGLRKPFLLGPCLVLPLAAFGTFYFNNLPLIIASTVVMGVATWLFIAALFTIPMELPGTSVDRAGLAVAVVGTLGNLATAISPLAVGISTDRLGSYLPSFLLLAVLPLTAIIAGPLLPETGPLKKARTPRSRPVVPAGR